MKDLILDRLRGAASVYAALSADDALADAAQALARRMAEIFAAGNRLFLCGNGGSASDAQHFAAELTGYTPGGKAPRAAIALGADTAILTAVANDASFDEVFARQVQALAQPGDLLICISTSGNSENLLRAAQTASARGVTTAALLGKGGGKLRGAVDIPLVVPSDSTPRIQECHILLIHILCELMERYA